jgi:chromosome partition protein MukB
LRSIIDREVAADHAHAIAIEALRRHRDLNALAERAPTIAKELREARKLAERQAHARDHAEKLGIALTAESSGSLVRTLLDEAESERAQHETKERATRSPS